MNIFSPKPKGNWFVLIPIFVILTAAIVAVGWLYYQNYKRNFRREVERQLSATAELKAQALSLWRQERISDADFYYHNAFFIEMAQDCLERPGDKRCQGALKEWFTRIHANYYCGVFLLDTAGMVRLTASDTEEKLSDIAKQQTCAALQTGKITFVDFYRNENSKKIFLELVIPLINRTDGERIIGALVWRIDPHAYLYPFIQQWPISSRTAETLIVRKEGDDILFLNELRFQKDTALNLRFPLETSEIPAAMAVKGHRGIIEGKDYRGVPVIADMRPIPDSPWFMVNRMDIAEVFASLTETLWMMVVLILSLLLVLFFGVLFWQKYLAESALREREEDLAITLRSIGDAVIATDREGRVTRMNPVAEQLTGWSLAEAAGKPLEDVFRIINAQTRAPVENPIAKVLASGQVVGLANHTALIARDGIVRQIADSAAPIRDAEGRIRGIVLVFRDVSAEYQIKEVLQKTTEELKGFFNISLDLLCIADLEGNFIKVNKAWEDVLGYHVTELEKRKFLEFVHPEDMQATLDAMAKLGEGKRVLNFTSRYKCKDGSYRFIEWRSNPHGNLIYAAARDITERKRVEDELRKLSQAVVQSPAIVVITDPLGNIEYVNPKFSQVTGYDADEALGQNPRILKSGELSAETYKQLWATITSGGEWRGEFHNKKKDGTLYWESALIAPVMDANGRIAHFLAIKEDITERKQAEEALSRAKNDLEKANKQLQEALELESKLTVQAQTASAAKSQFVANISHEIRTPLNGVVGICELLLETKMTKEQLEYAQTINSSAKALLDIINATLDFSKIESGRMELEHINFNLKDVLEDIISVLTVSAAQKKLALVDIIEPNVPLNLNGDPGYLRQVLVNLIGNAIKFTHEGRIEVKVELVEHLTAVSLRFSVRDTGIGIPADKTNLLFTAFSQVDATLARKFGGTGLGLAISKGLVEQMGGSIGVKSVHGKGSTFWFIIPFSKQRPDGQLSEPSSDSGKVAERVVQKHEQYPHGKRLRILVAEDNMANQMVIVGILEKMGHTAVVVAGGGEAVKSLETIPYDLVLMDIQMPGMDGFEATRRIRAMESERSKERGQRSEVGSQKEADPVSHQPSTISHQPFHRIPILALTAHAMPEDREKCLAAGMNGYITKPVSTKSVADAIAGIAFPINAGLPSTGPGSTTPATTVAGLAEAGLPIATAHQDKNNKIQKGEPAVVFDIKAFTDRLSGDNALIREVVNVFMAETPKNMRALEHAIKQQKKDEAMRRAHTIKGSAANVGGNQFRAVAAKVETVCTAENWREAEVYFPRLSKQFEFLERAMREFLKTLS